MGMRIAALDFHLRCARQRTVELCLVGYRIFWLGDMTTIRAQLAVASVIFSVIILGWPTMDRPAFAGMSYVAGLTPIGRAVGPAVFWASLFTLHGLLALWRIWDSKPRPYWLLAINLMGFALWFLYTALINFTIGQPSAATALEMTILINAGAALARTGLNDDKAGP